MSSLGGSMTFGPSMPDFPKTAVEGFQFFHIGEKAQYSMLQGEWVKTSSIQERVPFIPSEPESVLIEPMNGWSGWSFSSGSWSVSRAGDLVGSHRGSGLGVAWNPMVRPLISQDITVQLVRSPGSMAGVLLGAKSGIIGYLVMVRVRDLALFRLQSGGRKIGLISSFDTEFPREVPIKIRCRRIGKEVLLAKAWCDSEPGWQIKAEDVSSFPGEGEGRLGLATRWGTSEFRSLHLLDPFPDIMVNHSVPVRPKVCVIIDGQADPDASFRIIDRNTIALCGFQVAGRSGEVQIRAHLPGNRSGVRRRRS